MKQYKKPTRNQKELLVKKGYEPKEWRFVEEKDDTCEFVNPATKAIIFLTK